MCHNFSPDLASQRERRSAFARASQPGLNRSKDRAAFGRRGDLLRDEHRYLFHEYFHGDIGAGLGASHQTGRIGIVAKLIQQQGEFGTIQC